jgi:D-tyrosyl-tRNA(Tyr) deacylase
VGWVTSAIVVLLQRVSHAAVGGAELPRRAIGPGLVLLAGVEQGDDALEAEQVARKCLALRVFDDDDGKMNLSVVDVRGAMLAVAQFTLCADTTRGRRPSFTRAAPPNNARACFNAFVGRLRASGLDVLTGFFGERQLVEIANDGPVTLLVHSGERT